MRVPQRRGAKGSLKWIQGVAEDPEHPVTRAIRAKLRLSAEVALEWRSPRAADGYAEYRDGSFLSAVDLGNLHEDLASFWPERGPQWDALAVTGDHRVLLIEAKAHTSEMNSTCAAGRTSRDRIVKALDDTKVFYGANPGSNWLSGYYQYANRLAHVRFLRERGVDAHFVAVYFVGDVAVGGPNETAGWAKAIDDCHEALGLPTTGNRPFLHQVFVHVTEI